MSRGVSILLRSMLLATCLMTQHAYSMHCMLASAPRLVFGQYDPHAGSLSAQTLLSIECTPAFDGEPLDLNVGLAGAPSAPLTLLNPATGETLAFGLYRDPAHVQPVDWHSLLSLQTNLRSTSTMSLPLYARIPAGQNVLVGEYQLSLTLLLDY